MGGISSRGILPSPSFPIQASGVDQCSSSGPTPLSRSNHIQSRRLPVVSNPVQVNANCAGPDLAPVEDRTRAMLRGTHADCFGFPGILCTKETNHSSTFFDHRQTQISQSPSVAQELARSSSAFRLRSPCLRFPCRRSSR
jgi:hypothetical protein